MGKLLANDLYTMETVPLLDYLKNIYTYSLHISLFYQI